MPIINSSVSAARLLHAKRGDFSEADAIKNVVIITAILLCLFYFLSGSGIALGD